MYHHTAGKHTGDYELIFLPEDAIVKRKAKPRSPGWLNIQTHIRKVDIHITKDATKYQGNLCWYKTGIVSAVQGSATGAAPSTDDLPGRLDVIGIDSGYGLDTTTIYYTNDAASVWGLQHPIVNHLFNDEGDTFDSQEYYITNAISDDLQNIGGKYGKYDLLVGLQKVSGINIENIRNIEIDKKKATITFKGGKKKVLSLA